jgi:glyoxylase I family protein
MRIKLSSIVVDDQSKALLFYTDTLGFIKKQDIPAGEFKWLTVVSPDDPDGTELVLEPNDNPISKTFQSALFEKGIPITAFEVDDVQSEYDRLKEKGVAFTMKPTALGPVTVAILSDTCGNLIQLYQPL